MRAQQLAELREAAVTMIEQAHSAERAGQRWARALWALLGLVAAGVLVGWGVHLLQGDRSWLTVAVAALTFGLAPAAAWLCRRPAAYAADILANVGLAESYATTILAQILWVGFGLRIVGDPELAAFTGVGVDVVSVDGSGKRVLMDLSGEQLLLRYVPTLSRLEAFDQA